MPDDNTLLVETSGRVSTMTLNRPKILIALNVDVMAEIAGLFAKLDRDPDIAVANADISEMQLQSFSDMCLDGHFVGWDRCSSSRRPATAFTGSALGAAVSSRSRISG